MTFTPVLPVHMPNVFSLAIYTRRLNKRSKWGWRGQSTGWSCCPRLHYWVIAVMCQITQMSLVMFTSSSEEDAPNDSHEDMKCQRDSYNQRLGLCQEGWVESCATCKGFLNVYSNLLAGYIWLLWVGTATILFNSGSSHCRRTFNLMFKKQLFGAFVPALLWSSFWSWCFQWICTHVLQQMNLDFAPGSHLFLSCFLPCSSLSWGVIWKVKQINFC